MGDLKKKKAVLGFKPTPVGKLKFPHSREFQPLNHSIAIDSGLAGVLIIYLLTFLTPRIMYRAYTQGCTHNLYSVLRCRSVILVAGAGCCF